MIYVMSDDHYFALGVRAVFTGAGHAIGVLPPPGEKTQARIRELGDADILLLAVENMMMLRLLLRQLSAKKTRIALFLKTVHGCEHYTGYNGVIRRQVPVPLLISEVAKSVRHNRVRKVVNYLTFPQRFVLEGLVRGGSLSRIAGTLHITEKRVYGHKTEGLARLGLTGRMNCRNLLIYSCLAQLG
ncbi:hypothetical protein ACU611_01370 [Klebsiella aerogenes]|uniref:hypothetical protein n=1 Tax=Klebsiella aerogenes TaxID=548 RepID=UPI00049F2439|nr:hypothetical protein [Klebsiella aerogenes]KDF17710.1 hypothetical protein AF47_03159 [Klebsiella aerogenes MGH 61]HCR0082551.1 hypothetical protein [Klebsiella aerogenes]HCR0509853.1 hypothetical protein [Klebsiella aerogenes]